jgi:glycosyltransferase involved in cell wall biosynthesis
MRVFIDPIYAAPDRADGGIRRIVEAQQRYLPDFGVAIASSPDEADLIANHGTALTERAGVPMVSHVHGLMWSEYNFGDWGDVVNRDVIDSMIRAQAITAPSAWVAYAIARGMLARPTVIYHGVDVDAWASGGSHLGYVLWNKARADQVSNPDDMNAVASLLPHTPFVSTFGERAGNVQLTGAIPYEAMRPIVQQAGVYLATARETFGIGTLEALAAGVPVAGWDYGGQSEIVIPGETGYLAEYGDYVGLSIAIQRCLNDRVRLSKNAAADARQRWGWQDKIAQYAALYQDVLSRWRELRPKVSVVVTCYNLGRYLDAALQSVVRQTLSDWECVVVDDNSTDDTRNIAETRVKSDDRFRYLKTPRNLKLSGARNYGWQHATGRYILFLDADDMLEQNALDTLARALDAQSDLHIAYGHVDTFNGDNLERTRGGWPGQAFNWHGQMAHLNQLPYASLIRREVLERSGGYRTRDWRAEDAALWCRLTSFGFRAAKVTEDATLIYRFRDDSKSADERRAHGQGDGGDWTAWYPWRLASTPEEGETALREKQQPNPAIVPFGAQGQPPRHKKAWPVKHHQQPAVSVIIPVGPGHAQYLVDALDSVQAQTIVDWEAIVINDTGEALDLTAHPWARVIETTGKTGAGAARNRGLAAARAPLVTFLDADDMLVPRALEVMLEAYASNGGRYIYSDWLSLDKDGQWDGPYAVHPSNEYDSQLWLEGMQHPVTILIPREDALSVGGFDEQLSAWEDWDFMIKQAIAGHEGARAAVPLLIYRLATGKRRQASKKVETALYATLHDRYAAYISGEKPMGSCCGGNQAASLAAQNALASLMPDIFGEMPLDELGMAPAPAEPEKVRLEYVGDQIGATTWICPSGRQYRAGREQGARFLDVDPPDAEHLLKFDLSFARARVVDNRVGV